MNLLIAQFSESWSTQPGHLSVGWCSEYLPKLWHKQANPWCKLVPGWRLSKRKSVPPYETYGLGRTLLSYI